MSSNEPRKVAPQLLYDTVANSVARVKDAMQVYAGLSVLHYPALLLAESLVPYGDDAVSSYPHYIPPFS